MVKFLFKFLTRLRSIVSQEVKQLATSDQQKVVYVLPYDTSLALESLAATVAKHNLPWQTDLLTHTKYGSFNNAPVIFLQHGEYLSVETNPQHPDLVAKLQELYALGDQVQLVFVYPHWGTNLIEKPSLDAQVQGSTRWWANIKTFWRLRKFAFINLYQIISLRDLSSLMLSSDANQLAGLDLKQIKQATQDLNQVEFLTDLSPAQVTFFSKNLAAYLNAQYRLILERRNSNRPLPSRKQLLEQVIQDPVVQDAILLTCKKEKADLLQNTLEFKLQQDKSLEIIDEIAADPRFSTMKKYDYVLRKLWQRFYSGIEVRGLEQIQDTLFNHNKVSLTYVPTHRSHIDYLLLSYILNEYGGIKIPHIAAGVNLNFWPIGKIFRRGGAFFLRRSFNNYLYAVIFKNYIAQLVKARQDIEFFIEGGRSRTGRLSLPKTGMLNMTLEAFLRSPEMNQYYVPIFIAYDKVFESATYVQELQGKSKAKESALLVLRNLRKLKYQGKVHVNFAKPIMISNYFTRHWPNWLEESKGNKINKVAFDKVSQELAQDIAVAINSNASISHKALFSSVIFQTNGEFEYKQICKDINFMQLVLQHTLQFNPGYDISKTSAENIVKAVVKVGKDNISNENGQLKVKKAALAEFNYYRNNIEHCFIAPALAAIKLEKNISDEQLNGFAYYFADVFNRHSFTNFTQQTLVSQVKYFENLLLDKTSEQRQLFAKQLDIYLKQLDTFMTVMVEALNKLAAEGKDIEQLQLSTITSTVVSNLKAQKSIYPDFADKTTINQLRNAFATAEKFTNITSDQLVEALAYVHTWLK
ncbi:1-acyl-sn-glycerol-3-phosphate acyltransferase [Psittacicella hinzii]|uniref:Glycerol-3-phosphate acyltransferase n=1 Tax=Psittacicella hinzii TaxID=2028575 RepID=A0A3A1YQC0_9GAMM|nr:1-acyl-sn-glycerol-3-phosphate acyltransferase [Psittacicella hinzii]RIY38544.1 hypothetical protein CKF58_04060 [Psittacicella hinzii]